VSTTVEQTSKPFRRDPSAAREALPPSPRTGWFVPSFRAVENAIRFFVKFVLILLSIPPLVLTALTPLSALLLMAPAAIPEETVIADAVPRRGFVLGLLRRFVNLAIGCAALVAVVVFAAEVVARLGVPRGPVAWGLGVLIVYALDVAILVAIGSVPLRYNVRNLVVRWWITLLTAIAFTVVVGLLTVLLGFVNGMYKLTADSGQPGNVIILADGATEEVFSNLGYNDVALVEREHADLDDEDRPLPRPVRVKRLTKDGREQFLATRETYCIVNRPLEDEPGRHQFVQVRGVNVPEIAGELHGLPLLSGTWFSEAGVRTPPGAKPGDESTQIEAVLGAGVAREFGKRRGQATLTLGDTFTLGDRTWVVVGIMNSDGTTFGSEVWTKRETVSDLFNRKGYTSLVLRVEDEGSREETAERARIFADHMRRRFTNPKVNAFTETEYFARLSQGNTVFVVFTMAVAIVMAIGGIFGVMNTMFAAVAQRIKDIGVLRILGFKRWQVLVSFLFESLLIAVIGGGIGLLLGMLADGKTATSVISAGQGGGGKTVIMKVVVDAKVLMAGAIFTLVMARLGGLIPALSATRLKLLESLR
jgi:cell division protein FtsX